jgi:hypothetical protein
MFASEGRCKMPMRPIPMLITQEKIPDDQIRVILRVLGHKVNAYIWACEKDVVFHNPNIVKSRLMVCKEIKRLVPGDRRFGDYGTRIKKTIFASHCVIDVNALGNTRKFRRFIVGNNYYLGMANIR